MGTTPDIHRRSKGGFFRVQGDYFAPELVWGGAKLEGLIGLIALITVCRQ